jgi:hypothetical protein
MDEIEKKDIKEEGMDNDIGLILWKLQSIEEFLPCYKSIIEQEKE